MRNRFTAGAAALVALIGATTVGLLGAAAPAAALDGTLPGNAAPSWQTNGTVNALAYANGLVYLGGDFTSVRPPGAAAGTKEVARNHLAAFNASTGALVTSFDHSVSDPVWGLAVSPDGGTLYVGGDFTSIDGASRSHVAAFSTSTGKLLRWTAPADDRVRGIAVSASTVYLGGSFSHIDGVPEDHVAAVSASTGAVVSAFSTSADNVVYAMALSKQDDHLYLAGAFTAVNGDGSIHAAAAIDPQTGQLLPLPAASVIPPLTGACNSQMKSVVTDADSVYFSAEGSGIPCFDGTFAAHVSDGSLKWVSGCQGATQAIAVINGVMYVGSHAHDDSADASWDPDAFGQVAPGEPRHLLARDTATGRLVSWYPNTNGGATISGLGPRAMATDGTQLFVGGEFTTVNGVGQQGFTRFSPSTGDRTAPSKPARPVAVARAGGKISIFVQPPVDIDDTDLVVRVYRDGAATPFATAPVHSLFWRQPILAFQDDGQAAGTTHTYTADAVEANGSTVSARSATSPPVTVVSTVPSYPSAVTTDHPALYWRMGEPDGPVGADSSDASTPALYFGTETFGQPGAVGDSDTAVTTDGSTGFLSSSAPLHAPSTYSVEAWIRTTTTSGGKIIGFGDRQGGYDGSGNVAVSTSYDRHLYMTDDGRVVFGVWAGAPDTLTTSASYNDGRWHHIVGTQGPAGMSLYVDGARVGENGQTRNQSYVGYWRVGGDNLNGWPDQPSSDFFAGTIDDVAVYASALSATQVAAHYVASGRLPVDPPPTLAAASPAAVLPGFSGTVTFSGTALRPGAVTRVSATGVAQTASARVTDSTHVAVPIAVAGSAPTGPVDVTVTDTDGRSASCAACLRVTRTATRLTLAASSGTVTYGRSVTLTARLTTAGGTALSGRQLDLFRRAHRTTSWTYLGRAYTGRAGYAQWPTRPGRGQDYYARYAGERIYLPAVSAVPVVYVRPAVATQLTATSVPPRTTVYVRGWVTPDLRDQYVTLQRYYLLGWHNVTVQRLDRNSRFDFAVRWRNSGVGYYRVTISGVPGYVGAWGSRLTLRVT